MTVTLRAARVNAGLSQQDVTNRTGIARSTLVRWERGITEPSEKNKARLCAIYALSPECIAWTKM